MSNIIIKERPDLIYCHRCDIHATYTIAHSSNAGRLHGDVFLLDAHISVYCGNCGKKILSRSTGVYTDKMDREV